MLPRREERTRSNDATADISADLESNEEETLLLQPNMMEDPDASPSTSTWLLVRIGPALLAGYVGFNPILIAR